MNFFYNYESILEISAVITTILQFLTGTLICHKYIQKKSTGETSGFPFICGFLSCGLWLQYGLLTEEKIVIVVNAVGKILMLLYILTYYVFTITKKKYMRQFVIALIILIAILVYIRNEPNDVKAVQTMGLICCAVTVVFFAAPLTMLSHVIKTKNAESLPFPLISASFVVSLQWLVYGVLIDDVFLQITNFLGCVLSATQLSLFICFPSKPLTTGSPYTILPQNDLV